MMLIPHNMHTRQPSKKLDWKKIGAFKITAEIFLKSYKLDLLTSMKTHNTFYISLLKSYKDNKFCSQIQNPLLLSK